MRISLLLLGILTAGLGCYGSFEQGMRMEGHVSYLVLAAPVVAASSAFIPYFAECSWNYGHRFKAFIWVLVLIPAAATVFFASSERVHTAKAGVRAENAAQNEAVSRAEKTLNELKEARNRAEKDAKDARKLPRKSCPDACLARWDAAFDQMNTRVKQAEKDVAAIQAKAVTDSPLTQPIWLLPLALDLIAFVAIWSGLSVQKLPVEKKVIRRRRKIARKPKTPPKQPAPAVLRVVP